MKDRVGKRLPAFTDEQKNDLNGSADFFGLNHYSTTFISAPEEDLKPVDYPSDMNMVEETDGRFTRGEPSWLFTVPFGMRRLLVWIKNRYDNPPVFITENGFAASFENDMSDEAAVQDKPRVDYLQGYIAEMWKAINFDGANVKGYFVWSLMDNFEWNDGYTPRFGIVRVNFTSQARIPKQSAIEYQKWTTRFSQEAEDGL